MQSTNPRVTCRARALSVRTWALLVIFISTPLLAQHEGHTVSAKPDGMQWMMSGPLSLPMSRGGSGTSWLPDNAPMFGGMRSVRGWGVMAHGVLFAQLSAQGGPRGDTQFSSMNWGMLGATHGMAGGRVQLRSMVSLDPFTVGARGYPLLLQTGESYRGNTLHDRQHPHDLFIEIAAVYDRAIGPQLAAQLYVAPVGEPAIGPVAFPHRVNGMLDPFAPLAHHWQDATHISFGVVTAALYSKRIKLETSLFNGREPDDVRTNLDLRGASLDSRAVRLTVNPTAALSVSISDARLKDAEAAHPGATIHRATASMLYHQRRDTSTGWSVAAIVGANAIGHEPWSRSLTLESAHPLTARVTLFSRVEAVEKSADELVVAIVGALSTALPTATIPQAVEPHYRLMSASLGMSRELLGSTYGSIGVGARGTVNVVPPTLRTIYGSRTPLGATVFMRWRPSRMRMSTMNGMSGHTM